MRVFVSAPAVIGPGLDGWAAAREALAGRAAFDPSPTVTPPVTSLPPAERRRATAVIRLAVAAAAAAVESAGIADPSRLDSVFASANGDGAVIGSILSALAGPERVVSPTQFHNSVHNSPAAYWAIGSGIGGGSTSLAGWDGSFASGLLHAAAKAATRAAPVLLCAYDAPMPAPLSEVRDTTLAFAVAMLLTPRRRPGSLASLDIALAAGPCPPGSAEPRAAALRPVARSNAAARSLRLLEVLAAGEAASVALDYLDDTHLLVAVEPC